MGRPRRIIPGPLTPTLRIPVEAEARLREAKVPPARWPMVLVAADLMRRMRPLVIANKRSRQPGFATPDDIVTRMIGGFACADVLFDRARKLRAQMQRQASRTCRSCDGDGWFTHDSTNRPRRCMSCRVPLEDAWSRAAEEMPSVAAQYVLQQRRWASVASAVVLIIRADEVVARTQALTA